MWKWLYRLVQCLWGLPQTILGFCVYLWYLSAPHEDFLGAVHTRWPRRDGVSLGLFIFTPDLEEDWSRKMVFHEYGHTFQSLILGPFYLLVIGLPSMIWNQCFRGYRREKGVAYFAFYTERWADFLGSRHGGERPA